MHVGTLRTPCFAHIKIAIDLDELTYYPPVCFYREVYNSIFILRPKNKYLSVSGYMEFQNRDVRWDSFFVFVRNFIWGCKLVINS